MEFIWEKCQDETATRIHIKLQLSSCNFLNGFKMLCNLHKLKLNLAQSFLLFICVRIVICVGWVLCTFLLGGRCIVHTGPCSDVQWVEKWTCTDSRPLCYEARPSDRRFTIEKHVACLVRLSFCQISHKRKVKVMFHLSLSITEG